MLRYGKEGDIKEAFRGLELRMASLEDAMKELFPHIPIDTP